MTTATDGGFDNSSSPQRAIMMMTNSMVFLNKVEINNLTEQKYISN